jgi:hypothetical protein
MIDLKNNSQFKQLSFTWNDTIPDLSTQIKNDWISEILDEIKRIDINKLSPLEALLELQKLQKQVEKQK